MATGRKMEDGLLHTDLVEWPSVRFLRESHKLYRETELRKLIPTKESQILSLFRMVDIWRATSKVIHMQLCKGKGTKIDGIGVITLDVHSNPAFFPDNLFKKCYNVITNHPYIKGSSMTQSLPYVHIAKVTKGGASRDEIEKVIEIIAHGIRWALDRDITSLMLQVGHIGELVIGEGKDGGKGMFIGLRFNKEFLKNVKDSQKVKLQPTLGLQMEKRRLKLETEKRFEKSNLQALGILDLSAGHRPGDVKLDRSNSLIENGRIAIEYLRNRLFQRHGMYAVRDCRQIFQVMDDTGDGEINRDELKHGFRGLGISLKTDSIEPLFLSMDRDGSGTLSIDELYLGLRGSMEKMRIKLINKCFDDLMKRAGRDINQKADAIATSFLFSEFSCDHFPDVQNGTLKFDDERAKFMAQLNNDMVPSPPGFVNRERFLDMYQDLNGCFETNQAGEDYFNFMVRSTWNYWDMRGFEQFKKSNSKVMKKDFRNDFDRDDCDDKHSVDDFSTGGGSTHSSRSQRSSHDSHRSVTSSSSSSSSSVSRQHRQHASSSSSSSSKHKRKDSSLKMKVTSLKQDPIPWECNEAWTHQEMRSSLASQPNLQKTTSHQLKQHAHGKADVTLHDLPADVFGDLSVLLNPKKLTWEVPFLPPNDHWNKLRLLLFEPRVSFDEFCRKLNVNVIEEDPPITIPALIAKIYEIGKMKKEFNDQSSSSGSDVRWTMRSAKSIVDVLVEEAKHSKWNDVLQSKYSQNHADDGQEGEDDVSVSSSINSMSTRSVSSSVTGYSHRSNSSHHKSHSRSGGGGLYVISTKSSNALPMKWLFLKLEQLYGGLRPSKIKNNKSTTTVLERVRHIILDKSGVFGIECLKNQLHVMDEDRSLTLDEKELKDGLFSIGIYLNIREIEELFAEFDFDKSGSIEYEEFMEGIKGDVSMFRKKLIKKAWKTVCPNHSRKIRVDDLVQSFDCEWFPSVNMSSSSSRPGGGGGGDTGFQQIDSTDIEKAFQDRYRGMEYVNFRMFYDFHHDLSAVINADRIFEVIVRNTWHVN
mmetsp:Transcript_15904/g.20635  ORF Transcript_15904/g.20635 Transcript_15904/m.20635 type:complete len:1035 (+) Transcript_15904:85-3189(+)